MTREEAFHKISDLVNRFEEQYESYLKADYNETLTRRDFIDPFFKALGWDIDNEQGYAEAYREVIHEDKVKVAGVTKAPDYSFRLAGGRRLFFVEAKKPSIGVKDDIHPAYQVRRYGWSAKHPISIITDFEEFSIYDCTKKPNPTDKASVARIKYMTFRDYLKEFDFIWETFSKEQVLKGSFDRFLQSDTHKKGTATVDKEFLLSLDSWRTYLATSISWNNKQLDEEEINFAVQQTINRLIFLRIAEDRGVEPYGNLKYAIRQGDYYRNLFDQFRKADEKYNSGLFDMMKDRITEYLKIDNKVIRTIINELYYPECPYEFSVLSVEILGSAYEQFLGKVIRITPAHHAKIEEKPEVRKAGGVYYTPQYIVDYIVKNTVGKLIEGKTPDEISQLRIVDPACGSGSFLIGAYQYLMDYHLNFYAAGGKSSKGRRDQPLTPDGHLSTSEKKRILLNNIYGVDIDVNAVEVTKLSLLLKCMEGETEASIKHQLTLWNERILPTLENNIKCGNSLIDMDFYTGSLDFGDERKIKPFNWVQAFSTIFSQGGFDAVIGNPPYVRQESLGKYKSYLSTRYKVYHGIADLYSYFIERSINLLNDNGLFGFIVANKWMRTSYGEPLRKWLKKKQIDQIIDFGDLPVFAGATTYTCILICCKQGPKKDIDIVNVKTLDFVDLEQYVDAHKIELNKDLLDDQGWNLASGKEIQLMQKVQSKGIPLRDYVKGKIYRGVLTGFNEAFVIDRETRERLIAEDASSAEIIKPFLVGRDIKRYQQPTSDKFLIFTRRGIDIKKYPAIKNHLEKYKKFLLPKPKDYKGDKWEGRKPGSYKWYEIQDTVDYYEEFEKPKIIWPGISREIASFAFDTEKFYGNDNNQIIITDERFLLGIINSKVSRYFLINKCDRVQGGFYRLKIIYVEKIPIPNVNDTMKDEISKLVDNILNLSHELQSTRLPEKIAQLKAYLDYNDERINQLVYQLYELNEEEIKIIEGENSLI